MPRVIPCLLLDEGKLVKTKQYQDPVYVGEPSNTLRIFNEKEAEELLIIDIGATRRGRGPDFELIGRIAKECFMPLAYGGGIGSLTDAERLFALGIEKIVLNNAALKTPGLISQLAARFGEQSIVIAVDVIEDTTQGKHALSYGRSGLLTKEPFIHMKEMVERGAGEILINCVEREGTYLGYDVPFIKQACDSLSVPVIASGGASSLDDMARLMTATGASAAVGSCFVFFGRNRAVLVNYPSRKEIREATGKFRLAGK